MPNAPDHPRRVTIHQEGPILVEGPVEVVMDDGTVRSSDRFVVAICTCRRSRTFPWCDTSHRRRTRNSPSDRSPAHEMSQDDQSGNDDDDNH
ncbi:CDGSH iron-sulfur domain-containing protein [Streptomyces sp. H10-C2]|uniref:CDGSH iron-sulfur domain-containing protein n=1 Tax=unclassified Streptomyces TaxID=2593676 RepID=UPI0024BA0D18|nr:MULTISPECIES: CDGSH iron-sulfur domain-containing protein [unclassified Streptomyces]MDJ0346778.1 CDGSH iron-sulfur domain-containing protein [Streptomyces sp. PH10-H1]MDJ0374088.1 CDGSH iron-sulfur domain-containing protein [Streptomyces sp. H10-C2]